MKTQLLAIGAVITPLVLQADMVTTALEIPAEVITNSAQYSYDIQTPSFWSNGLPAGEGYLANFKRETVKNKTAYATNSAPLYLEHLKITAADFYLKSDQPFVFNSSSNTVISGSGMLKVFTPLVFNAPVIWNAVFSSQPGLYMKKDVHIEYPVELNGSMAVEGATVTLDKISSRGHVYDGGQKASLFTSEGCFDIADINDFAGAVSLKSGRLKITPGNPEFASSHADVTASLVTDGLSVHFDASDESSIVFTNGNRIAEWRDKVSGITATPLRAGYYPVWRHDELGTMPVVDMAEWRYDCGGGYPLLFSTPVTDAKTVVMVVGSAKGGGWLWGSESDSTRSIHRAGDGGSVCGESFSVAWASSSGNVKDINAWQNGKAVTLTSTRPSGSYEILVLSRESQDPFLSITGMAFDFPRSTLYARNGNQQMAEFLVYDKVLSDNERKQVEKYLYNKWFAGRKDIRSVLGTDKATIEVDEPTEDGHEPTLKRFWGRSKLVKDGPGPLVLTHPRDIVDPLYINEGSIVLNTQDLGPRTEGVTPALPGSEGLLLHLDASKADTLSFNSDGGIIEWRDASGGSNKLVPGVDGTIIGNPPTLRREASNGKSMVDFGGIGKIGFMNLFERITKSHTVLMAINARYGGNHILSDTKSGGGTSYHRGSIFLYGADLVYDIGYSWFNTPSVNEIWEDMIESKPQRDMPKTRPQVIAFVGKSANNVIGRIGMDRGTTDRSGGLQVGEILVYNRALTDGEYSAAWKYLHDKWINDAANPLLKTVVATGDGAIDARVDATIGTLGGDGVISAKSGIVTVKELSDFSGSLVSDGGKWNIRTEKGEAADGNPVTDGLLAWFDPSREDLATVNEDGKLMELKAVNDETLVAKPYNDKTANAPLYVAYDDVNSFYTIDCDTMYSNRGLVWSTEFTNAQTVICAYWPKNGGGHIFGVESVQQAFQRTIGNYKNPILNRSSSYTIIKQAEFWIDGVHSLYGNDGMKPGWQIISLEAPTRFKINMMGYTHLTSTSVGGGGGQVYGETLVWDRVLTESERKSVEAYLAKKWLGKNINGYTVEGVPNIPGQDTTPGAADYYVPDGETTSIGYLTGTGGIAKSGGGTLELKGSITSLTGDIDVKEGSLIIAAEMMDEDILPVTDGLVGQFDASDSSTITRDENGVVTSWSAKQSSVYEDGLTAYPKKLDATYTVPTVLENELNGRSVIDTGVYGNNGQGLVWRSGDGTSNEQNLSNLVQTAFIVLGSQEGGGFFLGALSGEKWHRGKATAYVTNSVFNANFKGSLYIDGVQTPIAQNKVLSGGYQIVEAHRDSAAYASGFAFDRGFDERCGGQRLGEILLYDRALTDNEINEIRAYLWNRWYGEKTEHAATLDTMYSAHPSAGTVTVAEGATFDLNGFTPTFGGLAGAGTIDGSLTVAGTVVYNPGQVLTVSGTLTFGEEGTIVLPATWNGEMGRFKVISAASLAGVANLKNWRVEADLNGHRYIAKLIADGTDVYVEILGEGTMIFVR